MLPSHSEITYFLEVTKTNNFSRAAQRIGITQPTLTQAIKKLELSLGKELFIRSKKGVQLTKAGLRFKLEAVQLIELWENLKRKTNESEEMVVGNYSIGCHPSVGLYTLPYFIPKLIEDYPELDISLHHDLSRIITEKVISYQLDLGLVINPVTHPDLIMTKLMSDEVKIWKSLENKSKTLICDPSLVQSQSLLKKIKKSKIEIDKFLYTSSLENAVRLCEKGAGIAIIPERVVKEVSKQKLIPVKNSPIFNDELQLIYRVENKKIKAIQKIKEEIIKSLML